MIGRLLGAYRADAVSRYGLFSGCAMTLVSLPSAVCYGISSAIVPELAGERSGGKVFLALGVTIFVSLPAALALWLFPREIASFIYRGLDGEGLAALARCVKILSLSGQLFSEGEYYRFDYTDVGNLQNWYEQQNGTEDSDKYQTIDETQYNDYCAQYVGEDSYPAGSYSVTNGMGEIVTTDFDASSLDESQIDEKFDEAIDNYNDLCDALSK